MEEVLPETLHREKKLYDVGSEILLRSLSPKTLYSLSLQDVPPYLIGQQPRFLQHAPAGSLGLILGVEQEEGALGQGPVPIAGPAWPSPPL